MLIAARHDSLADRPLSSPSFQHPNLGVGAHHFEVEKRQTAEVGLYTNPVHVVNTNNRRYGQCPADRWGKRR
jgi:hypothetical protein